MNHQQREGTREMVAITLTYKIGAKNDSVKVESYGHATRVYKIGKDIDIVKCYGTILADYIRNTPSLGITWEQMKVAKSGMIDAKTFVYCV